MTFFRTFLMCAFCAVVSLPAWADEDPRMQQARQLLLKSEQVANNSEIVANLDAEIAQLRREQQQEETSYKSTMADLVNLKKQAVAQSKEIDEVLATADASIRSSDEILARQVVAGGCKLEFADGTILEHVDNAVWYTNGGIYIRMKNGDYLAQKQLKDLRKINGKNKTVNVAENAVHAVHFYCDNSGGYFDYYCKPGYRGNTCGETYNHDANIKATAEPVSSVKPVEIKVAPETPEVRLKNAITAIDSIALEKSVWKDAQGNFNTARLVSDSVAGVVLGTAGGVITSVVVKKNQLKKGFEDIVCTVGGQEVGSYGDEIAVGVK